MIGVGFLVLFGFSFVLFPCQGLITSPPDGTELTFLPGSTANIPWSFNNTISLVDSRIWRFTSTDGSFNLKRLARIIDNDEPRIFESGLSGVTIVKPATLILKNVNQSFDGTYQFELTTPNGGISDVRVFIAITPTVTLSCSSPITVNEGDDFTCVCRGEGGNPLADVTWNKNGVQIGGTGMEEQALPLRNVDGADSGTYKCVAQSHINATDEKSIEIIVKLNFKPNNTTLTPNTAVVGTSVVITCKSEGLPEPTYIITRNGTVVSTNKTYTISEVMESDNGTCAYECIASNKLGNDSACSNLTIEPRRPTTIPPSTKPSTKPSTTKPSTTSGKSPSPSGSTTTTKEPDPPCCPVWSIVIMVIAAVVVLVIIAWLIHYCKKKEKDGYRGNSDVSPGDGSGLPVNHYELDEEADGGVDNAYDTVNNAGATGSKSKPPENTTPDVYAAVDKTNREGKPLYATLDSLALQADNSKKKRDEERPGQTEYASIDFAKIGKADQE